MPPRWSAADSVAGAFPEAVIFREAGLDRARFTPVTAGAGPAGAVRRAARVDRHARRRLPRWSCGSARRRSGGGSSRCRCWDPGRVAARRIPWRPACRRRISRMELSRSSARCSSSPRRSSRGATSASGAGTGGAPSGLPWPGSCSAGGLGRRRAPGAGVEPTGPGSGLAGHRQRGFLRRRAGLAGLHVARAVPAAADAESARRLGASARRAVP